MTIAIILLLFLFSIIIHEVSHGLAALYFGDTTAKDMGRLTLDPLKHIDPVMSILVPTVCYFTLGFPFGGAKPVPVNTLRLRNPRSDMKWIALAGPASNIALAVIIALCIHLQLFIFGRPTSGSLSLTLIQCAMVVVQINLLLAFFNLIPLPPLDGGRIAVGLLPWEWGTKLSKLEPYGIFILIALIQFNVTRVAFVPAMLLSDFLLPR